MEDSVLEGVFPEPIHRGRPGESGRGDAVSEWIVAIPFPLQYSPTM